MDDDDSLLNGSRGVEVLAVDDDGMDEDDKGGKNSDVFERCCVTDGKFSCRFRGCCNED